MPMDLYFACSLYCDCVNYYIYATNILYIIHGCLVYVFYIIMTVNLKRFSTDHDIVHAASVIIVSIRLTVATVLYNIIIDQKLII